MLPGAIYPPGRTLGDDFDPDQVLGRGLARRLDGEHRLERGDRHRELIEVGLARGQPLELQARAT